MKQFSSLYLETLKEKLAKNLVRAGITEHDIYKLSINCLNESAFNENIFKKGWNWLTGRVLGKAGNVDALAQQVKQVKASLNSFQQSLQRLGVSPEDVSDMFGSMNSQVDQMFQQAQQAQGQGGQGQDPYGYDAQEPQGAEQAAPGGGGGGGGGNRPAPTRAELADPKVAGTANMIIRNFPAFMQKSAFKAYASQFNALPDDAKQRLAYKYASAKDARAKVKVFADYIAQYKMQKAGTAPAPATAPAAPAPAAPAAPAPAPAPKT
jgi:hypothetical protein